MRIRTMTFVIAVVMISLGSVQSTADVIIEVEPLTPQVSVLPSCTVEICCRPIFLGLAWHCFTKCTTIGADEEPVVTACRGGPTGLRWDQYPQVPNPIPDLPQLNSPPVCPEWDFGDSAHGPIDTYCGPFVRGHPDFPKNKASQSCVDVVATSTGCQLCDCIEDIMCRIQKCCVRYELLPGVGYGYNSNSSAFTAISACQAGGGGPIVLPVGGPLLDAPGWNIMIPLENCPTCP